MYTGYLNTFFNISRHLPSSVRFHLLLYHLDEVLFTIGINEKYAPSRHTTPTGVESVRKFAATAAILIARDLNELT